MFKFFDVLREEAEAGAGAGLGAEGAEGAGVGVVEGEDGAALPGDGDVAPDYFIGELTSDDVLQVLEVARQMPDHLRGVESKLAGQFGPVMEQLRSLQGELPSQVGFDAEKFKAGLQGYDPTNSEQDLPQMLVNALQDSLKVAPVDETTLAPFLDKLRTSVEERAGEQLVSAFYSPEELGAIIPPVADGRFAPQTARHKAFVDWYTRQSFDTQSAMLAYGPSYVKALKEFEKWESKQVRERKNAAGSRTNRLAGGKQPSGKGTRAQEEGPVSREEAFLHGFNSIK